MFGSQHCPYVQDINRHKKDQEIHRQADGKKIEGIKLYLLKSV